jgi:hypothetical protein
VSKHFGRLIDIFANLDDEGGIPRQQAALARVEVDAISRLMERDRRKIEALERERDELRAALAEVRQDAQGCINIKGDYSPYGALEDIISRVDKALGEEQ